MARLNIEDSIWADPRFQDLMIQVGNRHTAKGMVLELWTEAQRYWLISGGKGIPRPAWVKVGLPQALIDCGLAEDRGDFIYAIGSKDQFKWLKSCSENGKKGGPAAAKARRETKGKSNRRNTSKIVDSRPLSLSLSLPLSPSSSSSSNSEDYSVGGASSPLPPKALFIATYCQAYKARYGDKARPDLSGKVQGLIKTYVEDAPIERACEMIRKFCEMNDGWFVTKGHDFPTFLANLSKVGLALDTGRSATQTEARALDRKQANFNVFDKLIEESEREAGNG